MAEITEYTLAALVSTLLIGGSALTYSTFVKYEASSEAAASLAALVGLAYQALEQGYSNSTIFLPTSTVSCAGSVLSLAYANSTLSSTLPAECSFDLSIPGGEHTVAFFGRSSMLLLQVS